MTRLFAAFLVMISACPALAAEGREALFALLKQTPAYQARLVITEEGREYSGRVNWTPTAERLSLERRGVERVVIIDRAERRLYSLLPAAEYAVDYPLDSSQARGLRIPNPRDFALSRKEVRLLGLEKVQGETLNRFQSRAVFNGRNVDAQMWLDDSGIVRRVVVYAEGNFLEPLREMRLEDVHREPQPVFLFTVPGSYVGYDMPLSTGEDTGR